MTLKNITRQNLEPCYYIHVTKIKNNKHKAKKVRIETMTDEQKQEKKRLIEEAGRCLKVGRTIKGCKSAALKKMMSRIAANAVLIDMCYINHVIVSQICDGDFDSIQDDIDDIIDRMAICMAIISKKGEQIDGVLTLDQIDEAVTYTIYEQTEGRDIK